VSEPHKIAAKADAAVEAIIERLTVALCAHTWSSSTTRVRTY
jgi:hypothetical protein